jgi:hypothetical protein
MATLGSFQEEAEQDLLLEVLGDEAGAAGDPFAWTRFIWRTCDDICMATGCHYTDFEADLVADQSDYCPPASLYRVKALLVRDSETGDWRPLRASKVRRADKNVSAWRNAASGTIAQAFIAGPMGPVWLVPPPSADVTDGLRFEGFAKPGAAWEYDSDTGEALELTTDSECPIPDWAQDAIAPGAALKRIIAYPTQTNMLRRPMIEALYTARLGRIERAAMNWFHDERASRGANFPWINW